MWSGADDVGKRIGTHREIPTLILVFHKLASTIFIRLRASPTAHINDAIGVFTYAN